MRLVGVVGIGDSHMQSSSPGAPGMVETLAALEHSTSLNRGVSGQTTDQIAARFQTDVIAQNPVCVLINGGTNDLKTGGTQAAFLAGFDQMLSSAKTRGIVALVLFILPATTLDNTQSAARDRWNAALAVQTAAASYGANTLLIDLAPTVGQFRSGGTAGNLWDLIPSLTVDGTHLTAAGYAGAGNTIDQKFKGANLSMANPNMALSKQQFANQLQSVNSQMLKMAEALDDLTAGYTTHGFDVVAAGPQAFVDADFAITNTHLTAQLVADAMASLSTLDMALTPALRNRLRATLPGGLP